MVTATERSRWNTLSYIYMTELSDDPEDQSSFIAHPLPWRSQSTYNYLVIITIVPYSGYVS